MVGNNSVQKKLIAANNSTTITNTNVTNNNTNTNINVNSSTNNESIADFLKGKYDEFMSETLEIKNKYQE